MKRILITSLVTVTGAVILLECLAYFMPVLNELAGFLHQKSQLFLIFRWLLILAFFFLWPVVIRFQKWPLEKQRYWLAKRWIILFWFMAFEVFVCDFHRWF